jgi:hypothetical protein
VDGWIDEFFLGGGIVLITPVADLLRGGGQVSHTLAPSDRLTALPGGPSAAAGTLTAKVGCGILSAPCPSAAAAASVTSPWSTPTGRRRLTA